MPRIPTVRLVMATERIAINAVLNASKKIYVAATVCSWRFGLAKM